MNDVLERVSRCVAEVLALQPGEVLAESQLMGDLGAESLDLVELMYVLEQEFDIRLHRSEMSLSARLGLPEEQLHRDEVLTPRALELLRARYPDRLDLLQAGITRQHLAALVTVAGVAQVVREKLTGSGEG